MSRRLAGLKAKIIGDQFEGLIMFHALRQRYECVRIPNGAVMKKIQGRIIPVPVKSPFDFILAKDSKVAFFDAKTIESGNFSYSMLTGHQVENLSKLEAQGISSGYLIFYRESNVAVFYKAETLKSLKRGQSLKIETGIILGNRDKIDFKLLFQRDPQPQQSSHESLLKTYDQSCAEDHQT